MFEVAVYVSPLFQPWVEVTHQCWTQQVINLKTTNSWLFVKNLLLAVGHLTIIVNLLVIIDVLVVMTGYK